MHLRAVARMSLVAALLLSGCTTPAAVDPPVLVLEYTLRAQGDDDGERVANPGPHCADARIRSDHIAVARDEWDAIGRPARLVVVSPSLEGNWATLGSEPFPLALPTEVRPGVENDDEPIVTLEWRSDNAGNEGVWADGRPVELPFAFTHNALSREWDAVALLSRGPDEVRLFGDGPCA